MRLVVAFMVVSWAPLLFAEEGSGAKRVYRAWTKAALVDMASIHVSKVDRPQYVRYVDLSAVAPDKRKEASRVLAVIVNSWSRYDRFCYPQEVDGTEGALWWFDLSQLRDPDDVKGLTKLVKAFDDLGSKGSGPAPFPEPYYHGVIQEKDYEEREEDKTETYYETVPRTDGKGGTYVVWDSAKGQYVPEMVRLEKKRVVKGSARVRKGAVKVVTASHLNKATAVGLSLVAKTDFPIFDFRWLAYNGLVEPRYHELLGLDDSEVSARQLAASSDKTDTGVLRGAVLFSEVAHHNRILQRSPSLNRNGRGSYWESYDFKASVDLQDVLKDTLNEKPDAKEIIFTLPNGLNGYFVVDGNGKRLDKADGDVANNKRSKFRDTQVRTAYHCMACHYADKGYVPVDDEVRALSKKSVTLVADSFGGKGSSRGERIRKMYLEEDINDLLSLDQLVVDVAVQKAGIGLKPDEFAKAMADMIFDYVETPLSLAGVVRETGYSSELVDKAVRASGLDPVFVSMAAGRKGRRDQFERGYNQLATILYHGKE